MAVLFGVAAGWLIYLASGDTWGIESLQNAAIITISYTSIALIGAYVGNKIAERQARNG